MQLRELARIIQAELHAPCADVAGEVTSVTHNTEWVRPGAVYVAIKGARVDGHDFVPAAEAAGAVAVVGEGPPAGWDRALTYLEVVDARTALAQIAALLHGRPSSRLQVVGVTGTDGKTTTSWMTRHLLRCAGLATGLFSSVGYELLDGDLRQFPSHFTTPEAPEVQQILRTMVDDDTQAVVLETSSHALAMKRVHEVDFDIGVWTNLSPEHLELHGSMEQYFQDKALLIQAARTAVLNADDPWVQRLIGDKGEQVTFSSSGAPADWVARNIAEHPTQVSFDVVSPLGEFSVRLPVVGRFNVDNALAAMAAAALVGVGVDQLREGMASFGGVPGRMQLLPTPAGCPRVVIDFAHTALSVENVLTTLRPSTEGRLWIVMGSAGDRDPTKRGPIGQAATTFGDVAVFTEEDPRSEAVEDILAQMVAGAKEGATYKTIADRSEAIRYAIHHACADDTVVLAGKGPEPTMQRGQTAYPWDEENEAMGAISSRGG